MKREANFTLRFRHWLKANPMYVSAAFELKQTTGNSIPFSDVQEHQENALLAVKYGDGFLYKAPDDSRGAKPFDLFYMYKAQAYVVVKFPTCFCLINILSWMEEKKASKRKSLTCERAQQIAVNVVEL